MIQLLEPHTVKIYHLEDKEYEVVSRDFFRSGLISHNKYILQEITNNEGDEENASEL